MNKTRNQEHDFQAAAIWEQTLADLRLQMTRATFETHLAGSQPLAWDWEANAWTIGVRGAYSVGWLANRLQGTVKRALARHTETLPEPRIVFEVAPMPSVAGPAPAPAAEPAQAGAAAIGEEPGKARSSDWEDASPTDTDLYIRIKIAFRQEALRRLKGVKLSVFVCLALHVDRDRIAAPGVEQIMRETGYGRRTVRGALKELASPRLRLIEKMPTQRAGADQYRIRGYAWFGRIAAPALYEVEKREGPGNR